MRGYAVIKIPGVLVAGLAGEGGNWQTAGNRDVLINEANIYLAAW